MTEVATNTDIVTISVPTPFIIGPVNAFLIKRDPLTLVDVGPKTDDAYEAIVKALNEHRLQVTDLEVIFITHGHVDHIGLLKRLVDESGAKTFAHEYTARQSEDQNATEKRMQAFVHETMLAFGVPQSVVEASEKGRETFRTMSESIPIDQILQDGDCALEHDVYYVPGHSSMDTLFVDANRKRAFVGDHILRGLNAPPMMRRSWTGTERARGMPEYIRSLRRTRDLDLDVCYAGHGGPITDHRRLIDSILDRIERKTSKVKAMLAEKPMTPHQLTCVMFPDLPPEHTYIGLSTAIGHLDLLEERGEVHIHERNGALHYSTIETPPDEG